MDLFLFLLSLFEDFFETFKIVLTIDRERTIKKNALRKMVKKVC